MCDGEHYLKHKQGGLTSDTRVVEANIQNLDMLPLIGITKCRVNPPL